MSVAIDMNGAWQAVEQLQAAMERGLVHLDACVSAGGDGSGPYLHVWLEGPDGGPWPLGPVASPPGWVAAVEHLLGSEAVAS
jgi:hypothetical protein